MCRGSNLVPMTVAAQFADRLLAKYEGVMDAVDFGTISDDLRAGEDLVAAISVVEMAPVTAAEIDELVEMSESFDALNQQITGLVAAKARQRIHA